MIEKRPTIWNKSTGPPGSEAFFAAMRQLCEECSQDKDVLGLLAHIQKRLYDCGITTCTHADLLENSFKHGCEEIARGISITAPIAWFRQDCDRQIKKLKYIQQRKESAEK